MNSLKDGHKINKHRYFIHCRKQYSVAGLSDSV